MPEPPPGYNYRSRVDIAGVPVEVLLDGGAAFSLMLEELLVDILICVRRWIIIIVTTVIDRFLNTTNRLPIQNPISCSS